MIKAESQRVCSRTPFFPSLMYDKAFEADGVMRREAADSHQGQGHDRSSNRPDRFLHSTPPTPKRSPCAGGVHRLSYRIDCGTPPKKSKAATWPSQKASAVSAGYALTKQPSECGRSMQK